MQLEREMNYCNILLSSKCNCVTGNLWIGVCVWDCNWGLFTRNTMAISWYSKCFFAHPFWIVTLNKVLRSVEETERETPPRQYFTSCSTHVHFIVFYVKGSQCQKHYSSINITYYVIRISNSCPIHMHPPTEFPTLLFLWYKTSSNFLQELKKRKQRRVLCVAVL